MSELVGLAYDQKQADSVWSEKTIRESYQLILEDEFRRKVDYRSMLYHKGQVELLSEFESLLRQGGEKLSIVGLQGARFFSGVEDSPTPAGDLTLDYQIIRYFASLAMIDDFLIADPFLKELLNRVGFLKHTKAWSLLEVKDFLGLSNALREVRMQDILEASRKVSLLSSSVSLEGLVRNYIEFLSYTRNNGLTPFFYNNQSAMKQWGNLVDRKNLRSGSVVDLSMKPFRQLKTKGKASKKIPSKPEKLTKNLAERIKLKRERDALIGGLTDSDALIRQKAAESLGKLGDPEIIHYLVQSSADSESQVRQEVIRTMAKITESSHAAMIDEHLLRVLADDEAFSVRLTAAHLLQSRKVKQAVPVLIDLVEQMQPHFSTILAYHSALPKDAQSMKRLFKMSHSPHPEVRRDVAFILGRVASKSSAQALEVLCKDSDDQVKCNALYSLWDLRSSKLKKISKEMASLPSEKVQSAASIVYQWAHAK